MFKKIIWQLIVSYFLVIIVSMILMGLILFRSAEGYLVSSLESQVSYSGRMLSRVWESYFKEQLSLREERSLKMITENLAWQYAGRIIVCDAKGTVMMDVGQMSLSVPEKDELIEKALQGEEGSLEQMSLSKPAFAKISVCYPIKIIRNSRSGEEIAGAVFVTGSLSYTREVLLRMSHEYGFGIFMSALILAIASTLFSIYISRPIINLTAAAERMSTGDLLTPVRTDRQDEIGELSRQFDNMRIKLRGTLAELLEEERKMQTVLSNMADGVIVCDVEGQIMMVNGAACDLTGCYTLDEVRERFEQALIPFDRFGELLRLTLENREPGTETMKGFEGGRIIKVHHSPLVSEDGSSQGVIFLLHDITELSMLDDMRTDFVSNVSHELKTPLACIKGFAELLQDGALDDREKAVHFLSSIEREVDRLTRMVKSLLELSKLDSGLIKFASERFNASLLTLDIVSRLEFRASKKSLKLVAEVEPDIVVAANMDRVQQVLINLIDNAVRYSQKEGVITVRLYRRENFAQFHVIDQGPGISPRDCQRIFERFYRVDKARSREQGGTGLGLAIVKQIVENLGGKVWVKSVEGEGSDFIFTLRIDEDTF